MHHRYELVVHEKKQAEQNPDPKEIVVAVSPSFGVQQRETIVGIPLAIVIREISAGIEEEGFRPRFIKYYHTCDLSAFANEGAKMSGSGISVGIQSKGTCTIHQKDLELLDNLEIFPQAPLYDGKFYRQVGKNASKYGKGEVPNPVKALNDQYALAKYQIKAALLQIKENEILDSKKPPMEIEFEIKEVNGK